MLNLFTDPAEDNDKYEIINEILNNLEHQNPISGFREIHSNEYPQLHQKAAKKCSNTEIPQNHNECSLSNTFNVVCTSLVKISLIYTSIQWRIYGEGDLGVQVPSEMYCWYGY